MNFDLSEEDRLIQQSARDFATTVLKPAAARLDREERFPLEHVLPLAELGFWGMAVPQAYGGFELSNVTQALVLEEINFGCASTGVMLSVHSSLVAATIAQRGSEEQRSRYLPRLARGELLGAYALTEHEHGSDAGAIEMRAREADGGFVLDGRKAWITTGASAGLVLVFATLDPALGRAGICAFLVERGVAGLTVGKHEKKLGIRASETVELLFEGVKVPASSLLGSRGEGYEIALAALDGGRIGIAAQATGLLRASLEDSLRYALAREQFGKPIARFQPVQWKIAAMARDHEAARLLYMKAAWLRDQGRPHSEEASIAKLFASEAANRAASDAVQIHGGAGYCKDHAVERYFRDAKVTELYEGTSEIQRIVIAKRRLGL